MRTIPLALISLLRLTLGACGVEGPTDTVPQPVDVHSPLIAPGSGRALAAPATWKPAPDLPTPRFPVSAARLFAAVQRKRCSEALADVTTALRPVSVPSATA